jgi:hypothetical protein
MSPRDRKEKSTDLSTPWSDWEWDDGASYWYARRYNSEGEEEYEYRYPENSQSTQSIPRYPGPNILENTTYYDGLSDTAENDYSESGIAQPGVDNEYSTNNPYPSEIDAATTNNAYYANTLATNDHGLISSLQPRSYGTTGSTSSGTTTNVVYSPSLVNPVFSFTKTNNNYAASPNYAGFASQNNTFGLQDLSLSSPVAANSPGMSLYSTH